MIGLFRQSPALARLKVVDVQVAERLVDDLDAIGCGLSPTQHAHVEIVGRHFDWIPERLADFSCIHDMEGDD